jgi:peptidoglycan/LPS O-acetylase OafA/YrhL
VAYTQGAMPVQPTLAHLPKTGSTLPAMTRADQPRTADTAWRADIDGLRAIAVIAVILFHAGFEFIPGGFTGVDIFFVVSGFLIGRQIITELDSHKFSFAQFWFRRARRILPALIVMSVVSIVAGWFILMPNDLKDTGRTALAQSVFASNIYFWLKADYFATPSLLKPLLHTWTLSLEEQFYLCAPILLLLLHRLGRSWLIIGSGVLLLVSFCASAALSLHMPAASFYLLPFRAWELLAGVLLAAGVSQTKALPERTHAVLGLAGLALIFSGFFTISESSIFPGYLALLPVVGAASLTAAGTTDRSGPVTALLSHPVLAATGKASYSLYLWHWPVFVYLRYMFGNTLPLPLTLAALGLTAVLGFVSWRLIEQPTRRISWRQGSIGLIAAVSAGSMLVALSGYALERKDGHRLERCLPRAQQIYRQAFDILRYDEPCNRPAGLQDMPVCGTAGPEQTPDIIVWGDSHTWAIAPALTALTAQTGRTYTRYQCLPVLEAFRADQASDLQGDPCAVRNRLMVEYIRNNRIKHVLFVAAWSRLVEPREFRMEGAGQRDQFVSGIEGPSLSSAQAKAVFARQFPATVKRLLAAGTTVWILEQVPQHTAWIANEAARAVIYPKGAVTERPLADHIRRQAFVSDVFQRLATGNSRVHLLDPQPLFCDNATCQATRNGTALYFDFHHLSIAGAKLLSPLLLRVFDVSKSDKK